MGKHLSEEVVAKLRRQELPAEEVLPALRHIAECTECAALGRAEMSEDVERAQGLLAEEAVRTRTRSAWMWAAAAALVIALSLLLAGRNRSARPEIVRDSPPVITKAPVLVTEPARPREWTEVVDAALAAGRLPFPGDLHTLRGEADTLRGESEAPEASLHPAGVYVDTLTPELSWLASEGATYVVTIVEGEAVVAQSPRLRVARWIARRPLARGHTYVWQVEVMRDGITEVLPAAEEPPAKFRIVSASAHDELMKAKALRPDDHLLLAVLAARAGLEAEARAHLARATDPRAASLRR